MASLILKPDREKSLTRRHPWIFSGAVARVEGEPQVGDTVTICATDGTPLAVGAYSPQSQIVARVWAFDPAENIGPEFFVARLQRALDLRHALALTERTNAYRLVNAESDGVPGLVVDVYADYLVCQFLAAGAEKWKAEMVAALQTLHPCRGIYERSDVEVRAKEGLAPVTGVLAGEAPPAEIIIEEDGCSLAVDVYHGHKTGFYLDQRDNRRAVKHWAAGREVLNCFAYTGAFAVQAARGGARRVTNVEASASALAMAHRNLALNGIDEVMVEQTEGDVFQVLRQYRDARRQFDLIVLDPPKFAEARSQVEGAARGYKDINLLAFKLLRPGGVLMTFSCSGLVSPDLFQKIVAGAALDAGVDARILARLTQAPDHPVSVHFPEGEYLKGLVLVNG